jgi:hypothetical protein
VGSGNLCDQYATTIALDGSGNIWTLGATGADSFPTTANTYSQTHSGAADIYVHAISADGSTLLYGTYFGSSGNDFPTFGMAMDSSGDIYFGGVSTSGGDYPLKDSVQAFGGSNDAVVSEILPGAGSTSLTFSTFLGGSADDVGQGFALDSQGNIHLSGATDSTDFPVVNALQTELADGIASPDHNDAFVAEFGAGLIGQVTPASGGNFGSTTIVLNGAGFGSGATATLKSGGSSVASGQFVKASADGATLNPAQSCTVGVAFSPTGAAGVFKGDLTVTTDAEAQQVPLAGDATP